MYNLFFFFSCDTEKKKNAHRGKRVVSTMRDSAVHNFNCYPTRTPSFLDDCCSAMHGLVKLFAYLRETARNKRKRRVEKTGKKKPTKKPTINNINSFVMFHVRFSYDLMLLIFRQTVKTYSDSKVFKNVIVELF